MNSKRFKELPSVPKFDLHIWADFYELLCLSSIDKVLHESEIIDREKLKIQDEIDAEEEDDSYLDAVLEKSIEFSEDGLDDDLRNDPAIQEENKINRYFTLFNYRSNAFKEYYPFQVKHRSLELKTNVEDSPKQLFYVYLLCCSALKYFNDFQKEFTSEFETVSQLATEALLPSNSSIHVMGKNALNHVGHYQGNIFSKISQIAKDLRSKLKVDATHFSRHSSGDGGLDIIGWVPFEDRENGLITLAGQSKCSKGWEEGHTDPGDRLLSYMDLKHPPMNVFFIPFCFRKASGLWHAPQFTQKRIVIDRERICSIVNNNIDKFLSFDSCALVRKFLLEVESLV